MKSNLRNLKVKTYVSLPVRGAWIEIVRAFFEWLHWEVAPRAGSVD